MAVYTHLSAEDLADLIGHYDVGELVSAKGIAEGISNSNWLIETTGKNGNGARFILTMYERRIDLDDLPFFLDLLDHLSATGAPVPRTIHDRMGASSRLLEDKAVALIEFLPGVSIDRPTPAQAYSVGRALAGLHLASEGFAERRANTLRPQDWQAIVDDAGYEAIASIDASLPDIIRSALPDLLDQWPDHLPRSIIHADLFPDNVLMLGHTVSGLIDFYFACHDITAYDLAVTHVAWCFEPGGQEFRSEVSRALIEGYESIRPLSQNERDAMPLLARGASMRFVATRVQDWLDTPADALVTRKDPVDFARRMQYYQRTGAEVFAR
ncbi:homoserine kinase [Parerythrobacter jejuensis]|uniref:Homoserine kinase n=1 Tax=Parerythrobacter jejuensis TaxID=795812 RepID=A0A845AQC0_9SPHN|nr:homoserine kinase [Parerythrobacter jejuensis]MXP31597.1 homoserine kinase [Parerythrobacter jejuensis]